MHKKLALAAFIVFVFGMISFAQKQDKTVTFLYDESAQPPEMLIDMIHLKAEILTIDPLKKYVETRSTYSFNVLRNKIDSLVFDAPGATVTKVKINALDVPFKKSGDKVAVFPTEKLVFKKEYTLVFELNTICKTGSPAFTGWDDSTQTKRKQIWGFSLNRIFPDMGIKHDLLTTELLIEFDSKYKVFSNGDRIAQKPSKNGTTSWHYKMNRKHYFGLLVFVIGEYNYETFKSDRGVPLEYWYYADRKFAYESTYKYSKEMFSFLEKDMGLNYPWELYRQAPVIDCPFGGMETTTATIYNDGMQCDPREFLDRNYINVNAHELTHQWFGNYNSYTNGQNIWTSESFATYFAKKFEQAQLGNDQFQKIRNDELNRTLAAAKTDDYPVGSVKGSVPRWYPKGSLVIDMLRYVMGEEEFKTFIAYYLNKHKYAVVEWNDLKVAIRESTGRTMDWFFEQWIHKGGEPAYTISYTQSSDLNNQLATGIKVQQVHETNALIGFFKMPIQIEVHYKDGSVDSTITWIEKEFTEVMIPNKDKKAIAFVLFDPNRNVVKQVNFNRSFDELAAQFTTAKNMIDRYDALLELKKTEVSKKRAMLIQRFGVEKFHLIKTEIISQLADDTDAATFDMFRKAITDPDAAVRRSVSANLKTIDPSLRTDVEQLLSDSSYQVIMNALDNLCFNFPEQVETYLEKTKNTNGNLFHNVRIKWLELAYEKSKDAKYLIDLRHYADINRYDNPSASAAISAMKRINYLDEVLLDYLFNAATYWSAPVNTPAKTALSFYYEQNAYRKLIKSKFKMLSPELKDGLKDVIK